MDVNDITDTKVISPLDGHAIPAIFTEAKLWKYKWRLNIDKINFNILDKRLEAKIVIMNVLNVVYFCICNYYSEIMPFYVWINIWLYRTTFTWWFIICKLNIRAKSNEGMEGRIV